MIIAKCEINIAIYEYRIHRKIKPGLTSPYYPEYIYIKSLKARTANKTHQAAFSENNKRLPYI